MADGEERAREWEQYQQLLALWRHENPIKTTKLQVLLAVNAGLFAAAQLHGGFTAANRPLYAVGAALSAVWLLSIGRTVLSQQLWKHKLEALAREHAGDPRFQLLDTSGVASRPSALLRAFGGVSSKFYLLGAPLGFVAVWLTLFVAAR